MRRQIHSDFTEHQLFFDDIISNFDNKGENFGNQARNSLKLFNLNGLTVNVKSFKIPNMINQIAYKFFRKSKAERSYIYANKLIDLGIGTPKPIGFYEFSNLLTLKKSFYISEHLPYDLTFRELTTELDYKQHESILRAFTRFTFNLHEKGINFLDHSPGNTLIQLNNGDYKFYLVDLNRMRFETMDFESRINNMSRLTKQDTLVKVISDEYSKLSGVSYNIVYNTLWESINQFQRKFARKKELKKKLLFRS